MKVRQAHFRRVLDFGEQPLAEVEVLTDRQQDPQLLAYFTAASNGDYSLVRVLSNDADYQVDWYDNSLHSAFEDVTSRVEGGGQADLAAQILQYDGVKEEMDRNLRF